MPTVLIWKGFRFYFFSNEGDEPPHIHIDKEGCSAKFWLQPVKLAKNRGFRHNELNLIERKVQDDHTQFIHAWNDFFNS